jgi:uncharacterized protein YcaQ
MIELTKQEAQEFLVTYQMINTTSSFSGKEGVLCVMNRLHSIQYDPLDVVGKNTDLVMQARVLDYRKALLNKMLYEDRTVIDGWDKMMAVYLTEDYPKMEHIRKWRFEAHKNTLKYRLQLDALESMDEVKQYIIENGPTYSSEIRFGASHKHQWGSTKTSSAALDCLFHRGEIGVKARRNTQKQYDLMENLIGNLSLAKSPFQSEEDFIEYYLLRRIESLGLFRNRSGVHISGPYINNKKIRDKYLPILVEKGLIEEVMIEGFKDILYRPTGILEDQLIEKVSIIAPLDNLIWDRDLIENLFDFKYRWEVYTPVVKREYGYYVLPLLYKSTFVGRIEFKQHRKNDKLEVLKIWREPQFEGDKYIGKMIKEAIKHFEKYVIEL